MRKKLEIRSVLIAGFMVAAAGAALAGTGGAAVRAGDLSGVSIVRIESGIEARVLDEAVSQVEVEVFDVKTNALVWTGGRISGRSATWPANPAEENPFRISIKGWDQEGQLVIHQVATKILEPVADITFESIPAGTKVTRPDGGLFVWIELPEAYDTDLLYRRAVRSGILFAPGTLFSIHNRYNHHLRLSSGTWNDRVEKAIARLGRLCVGMRDERTDDRERRFAVG